MKNILKVMLILLLSIQACYSCSCFYEPMSVKKINQYNLVFKGKVIGKEKVDDILNKRNTQIENSFKMEYFQYTFEVMESVKNVGIGEQTIIYSSSEGSSCGVDYMIGSEFYIFSFKVNDINMTGLCANNISVENVDKDFKRVVDHYLKPGKRSVWKDEKCVLAANGNFENGKPNGLWTYYNTDGTIQSKGRYEDGLKEGIWLSYLDEKDSIEFYSILTEDQKLKVKSVKNIIDQQEIYSSGVKVKMNYRFVLGGI